MTGAARAMTRRDAAWGLVLALLFVACTWPVILAGGGGTNEWGDQVRHHEPFIREAAAALPHVDLTNYSSATTPGYHLALAVVARLVGDDVRVLQLAGNAFGLAFVLLAWRGAARFVGGAAALALVAPLALSQYVLGAAIWLTTDDAGWLLAAAAIAAVAFAPPSAGATVRAGLWSAGAALVRQLHVWSLAPGAFALLMRSPAGRLAPPFLRRLDWGRGRPADALGVAALLLGPAAVTAFALAWGGLVPPAYQAKHASAVNPAAIAITLALFGVFGAFFAPALGLLRVATLRARWPWLAAGAGVLLWVALPTSHDVDAGRWGALWTIAGRAPAPFARSLLFLPLMAGGAVAIAAAVRAALAAGRRRETWIVVVALVAWQAAQCANAQAWQRYAEPMVLLSLAWLVALAGLRGRALVGPIALAALQFVVSWAMIWRVAG